VCNSASSLSVAAVDHDQAMPVSLQHLHLALSCDWGLIYTLSLYVLNGSLVQARRQYDAMRGKAVQFHAVRIEARQLAALDQPSPISMRLVPCPIFCAAAVVDIQCGRGFG
jgi:hypothetical protein